MIKAYIIPNMDKNRAEQVTTQVVEQLYMQGYQLTVGDHLQGRLEKLLDGKVAFLPEEQAYAACDFVLAIGGDGTLLHAAPRAAQHKKPILGINNGKLGFMTEIDTTQLELLSAIKDGKYRTEERMLLDVYVFDKEDNEIFKTTVLNDAVITKGTFARLIDITIFVDEHKTMEFRGDGVIISSATGSTAYSLSAGGPIIEPNAKCIAVTPICPHTLTIKSFVLSAERMVSVPQKTRGQSRYLSVDGSDAIELNNGEEIRIKQSDSILTLIRVTNQGFYDKINGKLVKEVL